MNKFEFTTVERIIVSPGEFARIGALAAELGTRAMVVANGGEVGDAGMVDRLMALLSEAGVRGRFLRQRGEPTIDGVERAAAAARDAGCDMVIGLGGGSAIDAAKAVAGLLTNGGSPLDYMEVVGEGRKLTKRAAPWIAVPTTAGTGAEVTRNAVLADRDRGFKASMRSNLLFASVALVDPELGVPVAGEVTARAGMDALCQLIESYTSARAHPMTDGMALQGLALAAWGLPRAVRDGMDLSARGAMATAALISGITLTHAGLGAVHGLAGPMGGLLAVPHGTVCAALLAGVMAANAQAMRAESDEHPGLTRYAAIGRTLTGKPDLADDEAVDAGVEFAAKLTGELKIPGLREFGLREGAFDDLIARSRKSSSMRYNPVALSDEALRGVLRAAL